MKNLLKYIALLIIICANSYISVGNVNMLDSLRAELLHAKHDSIKCNILLEIGKAYEVIHPDSSLIYYYQCLDIAENNNYTNLQIITLRYLGNWHIDFRDNDAAMKYLYEALELAEGSGNKQEIGRAYISLGLVYNNINDFLKAMEYSGYAVEIAKEIGDKTSLSYSYNNIGLAYYSQHLYSEALKYFLLSCDIDEELGDIKGVAQGYINIGMIHYSLGNYDSTIAYYLKAIEIAEELNEIIEMSIGYNNIAIIYKFREEYEKALDYLYKALEIDVMLGDVGGMAICYINLGSVHSGLGNYDKALNYLQESLKIWEELKDNSGKATVLYYLSDIYIAIADENKGNNKKFGELLTDAISFGKESFEIGVEYGSVSIQNAAASSLKEAYSRLGNFRNAYEYLDIYVKTRDILINEEKIRAIADAEKKWEAEKKQYQIEHLKREREVQDIEILRRKVQSRHQRLIIFLISLVLLLITFFSFFILNRFRLIRKQMNIIAKQKKIVDEKNIRLSEKNEEIKAQNAEIEAQNQEIQAQRDIAVQQKEFIERQNIAITDSINYAKRIQQALLPSLAVILDSDNGIDGISESFVLFKPKEIVSGDFYWANRINNHLIVAVADCTGHGVPGGFMSMLGISFLNEIVNKQENFTANEILNQLRDIVGITLRQAGKKDELDTPILDGINIVIAVIDLEKRRMQYAGSFNPLYMIRNNELSILKTDKTTIGMFVKNIDSFRNHHIFLNKGDTFYMFSDGFIDQFDEEGIQRYKYSRFKNLLLSIQDKPMEDQKDILNTTFENWKGKNDQIDDVTILGFRI